MQSLFDSLGEEKNGKTIGLGGDGRYFNKEAAQKIIKLAAANGIKKVCTILLFFNTMMRLSQAEALVQIGDYQH